MKKSDFQHLQVYCLHNYKFAVSQKQSNKMIYNYIRMQNLTSEDMHFDAMQSSSLICASSGKTGIFGIKSL